MHSLSVNNGKTDGFIGENKVYIGRYNKYYNLNKSPLANPFTVGVHGNRDKVLLLYKQWFEQQIKNPTSNVAKEIDRIKKMLENNDIQLVCWCKPLDCHGYVIKEYIENGIQR